MWTLGHRVWGQRCDKQCLKTLVLCFAEIYAVIHPEEKGKTMEEGKFGSYGRERGSVRIEVNVISSIV